MALEWQSVAGCAARLLIVPSNRAPVPHFFLLFSKAKALRLTTLSPHPLEGRRAPPLEDGRWWGRVLVPVPSGSSKYPFPSPPMFFLAGVLNIFLFISTYFPPTLPLFLYLVVAVMAVSPSLPLPPTFYTHARMHTRTRTHTELFSLPAPPVTYRTNWITPFCCLKFCGAPVACRVSPESSAQLATTAGLCRVSEISAQESAHLGRPLIQHSLSMYPCCFGK